MMMMHALVLALLVAAAPAPGQPQKEFVRSDQASKQRAPFNTADVTYILSKEFKGPADADAKKVIAHLSSVRTPFPVYLGTVQAWRFAAEPAYREGVIKLATLVTEATGVRCLVTFEEEAPGHGDKLHGARAVPAALAGELANLANHATLAMATFCDGLMTREQVRARVSYFHDYYGDTLKIPLHQMFIDVNLAQTAAAQDYGSREHLENFDRVVGWALEEAYAAHFGGFHTMGSLLDQTRVSKAADSTYHALGAAWDHLVAAHPEQTFPGLKGKPRKASGGLEKH